MQGFIPADAAPQPQNSPSGEAGNGGRQAQMLPPVVIRGLWGDVITAQIWAGATTACAIGATAAVLTSQPWQIPALWGCAATIAACATASYGQRLIARYRSMFDRTHAMRDDMHSLMTAYLRASTVTPPKAARYDNIVPIKRK